MLPGEMRPMHTGGPLSTGRLRSEGRWAQTITYHVLCAVQAGTRRLPMGAEAERM